MVDFLNGLHLCNNLPEGWCDTALQWYDNTSEFVRCFLESRAGGMIGDVAQTFSVAQDFVVEKGGHYFCYVDDIMTKWLLGCGSDSQLKGVSQGGYRFHQSFALMGLTTLCGLRAMKYLGLSKKFFPWPFCSKKIITVISVKLPGEDVYVDKVREEERDLETSVRSFGKAIFWAASCSLGVLGLYFQIAKVRGQEGICMPDNEARV